MSIFSGLYKIHLYFMVSIKYTANPLLVRLRGYWLDLFFLTCRGGVAKIPMLS